MSVGGLDQLRAQVKEAKARGVELRFGVLLTTDGQCPIGATSPMACTFCSFGHMLECHHPLTCNEAECSHWRDAADQEGAE